ncbi:MAG: hypothetical protein HRU22_10925, partial [Gammaproteobacteria bacterium]|nr:hypothetical protein [Gammaproteobacteria bacterium]
MLLVFLMNKALPGDQLANLSGIENPSFSQLEQLNQTYQLESSSLMQYIELCFYAMVIALFFGIPLGVMAAFRYRKISDNIIISLTLIGYSMPIFCIGVIAIMYFGLELQWLPVAGRINLLFDVPT